MSLPQIPPASVRNSTAPGASESGVGVSASTISNSRGLMSRYAHIATSSTVFTVRRCANVTAGNRSEMRDVHHIALFTCCLRRMVYVRIQMLTGGHPTQWK